MFLALLSSSFLFASHGQSFAFSLERAEHVMEMKAAVSIQFNSYLDGFCYGPELDSPRPDIQQKLFRPIDRGQRKTIDQTDYG